MSFPCVKIRFPGSPFLLAEIWIGFSFQIPEECPAGSSPSGDEECLPMVLSWEGAAEVQSGDILLVRIDDAQLTLANAAANHTVKTTDGDR